MGPIWGRQDPDGPHVGPMNLAIRDVACHWPCLSSPCINMHYSPPPPPPPPPHHHHHRLSVRVRSVAPRILVGSISYLYILSSNIRRCVVCKDSCKIKNKLNFWHFFLICNFDFVLFWFGIWCESLVWVIMGRQGVSQKGGVLVVLVCAGNGHYLNQRWFCQLDPGEQAAMRTESKYPTFCSRKCTPHLL